jgi:hypothetical protein
LAGHITTLQNLRNESWEQCSKLKTERNEVQLKLANYKHAAWTFGFVAAVLAVVVGVLS